MFGGTATQKFVCLPCRFVVRRRKWYPNGGIRCSKCGGEVRLIGSDFRAPKRSDDAGWKKVAELCHKRDLWYNLTSHERKMLAREGMFKHT